jgi:hypothetical protein
MFQGLTPVTDGLKTYHTINGRLSENLEDVFQRGFPSTAEATAMMGIPKSYTIVVDNKFRQFEYDGSLDSYAILFSYSEPGMNSCRWSVIDYKWACKEYL